MINPTTQEKAQSLVADTDPQALTACVLCSHTCGLQLDIQDKVITAVKGDGEHPLTAGYLCNKGRRIQYYQHHAQRLTTPLKKMPDGSQVPISWEQAIGEIGRRLKEISSTHSPKSIGLAGVGGQANHGDGLFALSFLRALGGYKWFNSWAQEKTQHHLIDRMMFKAPPQAFFLPDKKNSDYMMIFGSNPLVSHRGLNAPKYVKGFREEDRTLVVVDPMETETTAKADVHLQIKPAGDAYLLLGMVKTIVDESLFDKKALDQSTVGLTDLLQAVSTVSVEDMSQRCGIPAEQIRSTTRDFCRAGRASIMFDLGVEQIPHLTLVSYLFRVILVLTGNVGRPGGNFFATHMAPDLPPLPEMAKERMLASGIAGIAALGPFPMYSTALIPEEIEVDHPEKIRALIVSGNNPLVSNTDSSRVEAALAQLDLLVVMDLTENETSRIADYVLPVPSGYEKYEYVTFPATYPDIFVHLRRPVLKAQGNPLPEAEIYAALAEQAEVVKPPPALLRALGKSARSGRLAGTAYLAALGAMAAAAGGSPSKIMARSVFWAYRTIGLHLPSPALSGLWLLSHLFALTERRAVLRHFSELGPLTTPYTLGEKIFQSLLDNPRGSVVGRRDVDKNLREFCRYRDKKIRLAPRRLLETIELALSGQALGQDEQYPFIVNTGRRTKWNTNTIQRDPNWRKDPTKPHHAAFLNPDDAAAAGIEEGDIIFIESKSGRVTVPAHLHEGTPQGYITLPNGFGLEYPNEKGELRELGPRVNRLTDCNERDPLTGIPYIKYVACRIGKASNAHVTNGLQAQTAASSS